MGGGMRELSRTISHLGLGGDYKDGLLVIILYMFILWVFLYLCFVLQFKKLQHF
mgnify:CR=1 FL=1